MDILVENIIGECQLLTMYIIAKHLPVTKVSHQ